MPWTALSSACAEAAAERAARETAEVQLAAAEVQLAAAREEEAAEAAMETALRGLEEVRLGAVASLRREYAVRRETVEAQALTHI